MTKKIFKFRKAIILVLVILVTYIGNSIFIAPYNNAVQAIAYYYGSKGNAVGTIQKKLKSWGYYNGSIDNVYGYQTFTAVKYFQSKNGLKVDGVAGDATLKALGINTASSNSSSQLSGSSQDELLLARIINGEARGEPYEGQVAVGSVILNRTRDPRFPSSIAGVVYQPGAFTAIVDGQIHANLEQNSINAARDALNGWDPSGGAVYYFNPATATSNWIWSRPLIKVIGKHRFCR
ncbi:spore cortex-lytic enzyme [Clostridium tyrobutyricum]|jgi:N-acetylmuramoyl-L-alanine amidase|uniref:Spore cortex-lytic enzyme n=1 Tax=Clostridium tyrobutyricum DIVETGP TaxID=1408889 RepID=W6NGV7_CLOTY|nr:spore cortex-lytic enzyme [Clostridium tyrobutyricum]AND83478.1 spore cortex-lytic enzyme [Clostridium tyrobutyricum]ANP68275.1 spore cortex-lytic enzyme [Clostridium tyrobutyricum]MBV4433211.1 spore cortex-lytic enzyme [Clostridium tyrobutyricum]MBV4445725.1 spore cortex-lytic enzyme [Clostridium tyrobutyricum]QCH27402.1 Spore cortex-lytic enzyme precursor [Clostridium tyrobutyricum]